MTNDRELDFFIAERIMGGKTSPVVQPSSEIPRLSADDAARATYQRRVEELGATYTITESVLLTPASSSIGSLKAVGDSADRI